MREIRPDQASDIYKNAIGSNNTESDERVLIEDQTLSLAEISEDWESLSRYLIKNLPPLTTDTLLDFQLRNSSKYSLRDTIVQDYSVSLVPKEFEQRIEENGWNEFYTENPNAKGLFSVSSI